MDWSAMKKQAAAALSGAVTVAAGVASRAAEVAKDLAEEVTSFKCMKGYKLAGLVATAGPNSTWKIFHAVSTKPGVLCVRALRSALFAARGARRAAPQSPPTNPHTHSKQK